MQRLFIRATYDPDAACPALTDLDIRRTRYNRTFGEAMPANARTSFAVTTSGSVIMECGGLVTAHAAGPEEAPADINHAIDNTLTIACNEYKFVADVSRDFAELPLVSCHINDINQVILVINADHAIADVVGDTATKGRITVSARQEGDDVVIDVAIPDPASPKQFVTVSSSPSLQPKKSDEALGRASLWRGQSSRTSTTASSHSSAK